MLDSNTAHVIAVVVCGAAAVTDMRTGLIPNWLTFPVIAGAPLVHGWLSGPGALLRSLLALLLCGLVPYLMFRRGGMGGGDVKLFAAVGAVAGLGAGLQIELVSMLLACVWGLGLLVFRGDLLAVLRRALQIACTAAS
jgi:prepilin peptidase CpaA